MTFINFLNREKRKIFNVKATDAEKKKIQDKANIWAQGNLSAWVRHAALNYVPTAQELSRSHDADAKD